MKGDELGNERMHFSFTRLPPHATKVIAIEAKLAMANKPNRTELGSGSKDRFTKAEPYIEADDKQIVSLATELRSDGPRSSIEKMHRWVKEHMSYAGYVNNDQGALYAFHEGRGDCTEYAYLTTALGRAQGFPVRTMAGFVAQHNSVLSPAAYHNWTEFYLDGAWWLVDTQRDVLMRNASHYIATRILTGSRTKKDINSHLFFRSFGGIEVQMDTPSRS